MDNKTLRLLVGTAVPDVPYVWTGAAGDGKMNTRGNWIGGEVPPAGATVFIPPTAGEIENDITSFAPASITFGSGAGVVTIGGNSITGVLAITNNAACHHVFNCPVVCADNITPDITRGSDNYMTFAGGITMFNAPKTGSPTVDYWSGNVTVTTESAQEYKNGGNLGQLVAGTTFSFDNGIIDHMFIEPGATSVVKKITYNGCARNTSSGLYNFVFDNGNGVLRVKEIKTTSDATLFHSWAGDDQYGGTIIAEKLVSGTTKQATSGWAYPLFFLNCGSLSASSIANSGASGEGVWAIGHGGLSFDSAAYDRSFYGVHLGKTLSNGRPAATIHSYEDWALDVHPLGADKRSLEISSGRGELLVIDTSHYAVGDPVLDAATSHTVTLNGKVQGGGAMRVEGNGKVVFANANNTFDGGLTITNTATVSVNAGCKPGNGAVTVHAGTTLQVAESGEVALGGNLTLKDDAILGFNFTERTIAPTLAIASGKTVTASGTVKVAVSGKWPKGRTQVLTSGGKFKDGEGNKVAVTLASGHPSWARGVSVNDEGNIVLTVKPMAVMVTVK